MSNDREFVNAYLRIPKELHARVKNQAIDQGISLNQFVVNALVEAATRIQVPLYVVEDLGRVHYVLSIPPELMGQHVQHSQRDEDESENDTGISASYGMVD
jgi:hypothetical protein